MKYYALVKILPGLLAVAVLLSVCGTPALAEKARRSSQKSGVIVPDTDLIDTPTAGVLDYYGLLVRTRAFSNGGVLLGVGFGVLPRLNLGATISAENLIGTSNDVRFVRPEIQAKYRLYDGARYIPALAIGYDGQGYYYDRGESKYLEEGRGLYLAGSQEILFPGLFFHPGVNVSDFEHNGVYMFAGLNYTVENSFSLMLEWDAIQRIDESRFNAGGRFYVSPFFHIDLAVREIGKNTVFSNGQPDKPERIVQLRYNTSF
ncbi:MAG: hypothetical protein PHW69_03805 [Elusimicrobiaceae bacterium]|nr:hypothetical protein [Elusimicrobiaceae bacterium]